MTVLLGVSMGAHAVRMALPRSQPAVPRAASTTNLLQAPQQLFFKNQVIDTVDDEVEYLAAESIGALAAESEPPIAAGVAYRDAHQADTLHRALENQHLHNYHLVHEVEAVIEYLLASGEAAGYGTVALYDLGSSGLNVSVVDLAARRVIATRRTDEFSGDLFDDILRDNQLSRLGKPGNAPDIELFERRCRVAKERLSGHDAVCLPDESGMILLSRDSFETLISDDVDRSIEYARDVLIGANVPIDAVVLIGGGARMPLVRERVGAGLGLPSLTPNEPESVAARGAALSARPAEVPEGPQFVSMPLPKLSKPLPPVEPPARPVTATPRPTDATPTISISRSDLPVAAELDPLPSTPEPSAPVPEPSESPQSHFALKNVYWLDADYDDSDGDTDEEHRRRRIRGWSVAGVAAAAVIAASGFIFTRTTPPPTAAETAVTQQTPAAPSPSAAVAPPPAATTPEVAATSEVPVAPPPPPPPAEPTTTQAPAVVPEPAPVQQQPVPQNTIPQQQAPAPQAPPSTQQAPPPPAPPPLIPGLPDFTLPVIPPLFPPVP